MTDPLIGRELAGFRIEEKIGRGGMATVYRAEEPSLERHVALKIPHRELVAQDEAFRARFLEEGKIAARVKNPHLVSVFRADEADGYLLLAMDLIDGRTLGDLLRAEGALEPLSACNLIGKIGRALDALHQRALIHRDVKPANVLIPSEQPDHPYLTDFGIAKSLASTDGFTGPGQAIGTIDYMAPEQFEDGEIDQRVDVYALASTLFVLVVGDVPFLPGGTKEEKIAAKLLPGPPTASSRGGPRLQFLDEVLVKGMARAAEDRYASASEFGEAAKVAADGCAIADDTPIQLPPARPLRNRGARPFAVRRDLRAELQEFNATAREFLVFVGLLFLVAASATVGFVVLAAVNRSLSFATAAVGTTATGLLVLGGIAVIAQRRLGHAPARETQRLETARRVAIFLLDSLLLIAASAAAGALVYALMR